MADTIRGIRKCSMWRHWSQGIVYNMIRARTCYMRGCCRWKWVENIQLWRVASLVILDYLDRREVAIRRASSSHLTDCRTEGKDIRCFIGLAKISRVQHIWV